VEKGTGKYLMLKLNIGCGKRPWEGFVNTDFRAGPGVDLVYDFHDPLPYDPGTVDEIHALHVFEHIELKNWTDSLKIGGKLVLELPCLDKIIAIFSHYMAKRIPVEPWVIHGLYGDPRYKDSAMMHHWCYTVGELSAMMRHNGLQVELKDAQTHVPHRDMRLELCKPFIAGRVLEVGSYNVNGTVRDVLPITLGVDMTEGPGVDEAVNVGDLITRFGNESFDSVVSCDALEHMEHWDSSLMNMWGVLKTGGWMCLTMAALTKGYHGYPSDYHRMTVDNLIKVFGDNKVPKSFVGRTSIGILVCKSAPLDYSIRPVLPR
jgi:predicted SAM-dependent methyltransferase